MSIQKIAVHITSLVTILLVGVSYVNAAPPSFYTNPITYGGVDTVPKFLLAMVDLIFLIAVPIIVMCIIYSGFLFVTAGDKETQIAKAKTVLTWTLIGAAVLLGAKAIALTIQSTICGLDPGYSSYFCP